MHGPQGLLVSYSGVRSRSSWPAGSAAVRPRPLCVHPDAEGCSACQQPGEPLSKLFLRGRQSPAMFAQQQGQCCSQLPGLELAGPTEARNPPVLTQ